MVGDKVTGVFFGTREDGTKLYRFAVPNTKNAETGEWDPPIKKIVQDQTGVIYDSAVDVENCGYTYTETDSPVDPDAPEPEPEPEPETDLTLNDALDMLNQLGVETDDQ